LTPGQRPAVGLEDEVENGIDEPERGGYANANGKAAHDDSLPELVEVLQERHLPSPRSSSSSGGSWSAPDWGPGKGTSAIANTRYAPVVRADRRRVGSPRPRGTRRLPQALCWAIWTAVSSSDPDFLFEGALELVRGPLELGEALAERTAQVGQLAGAKNDESDHENDDQLRHANRTKHGCPAFHKLPMSAASL
jgi:hypothetical protein